MGLGIKTRLKRLPLWWVALRIKYYAWKNHNRPKLLIYTDSRGLDITDKNTKYNPFGFFTGKLLQNYAVDLHVCPEKHTTLIDFIKVYENRKTDYDFVIAYIGIVDFSPRHQTIAKEAVYALKKEYYNTIFGEENMLQHLNSHYDTKYEGENTINMFSLEMAEKNLIPYLNLIPNLIWIGCNNFVRAWEGNYFKARPENIYMIEEYSRLFCEKLKNPIDLSSWNEEEIKKYTCDNIHLTQKGSDIIFAKIIEKVKKIQNAKQ